VGGGTNEDEKKDVARRRSVKSPQGGEETFDLRNRRYEVENVIKKLI